MARTMTAAAAVFATAFVGGTLQAALSSDPVISVAADDPLMIYEAGVARFVTTDTGMGRFITTDTPRSPLIRGLQKLGFPVGGEQQIVITNETVQKAHELGIATVTSNGDGGRTLTVQTPSEWVFDLKNE
ncbi:MAG: hypothetical protein DHS20C16_36680 [Phycisphaerae bacterium]|nr:MAG: hypothetical protein DHS20C16_36680 [Phycisphaerae bacterium]